MKLFKYFFGLCITFSLTGCLTQQYGNIQSPSFVSDANFRIVDQQVTGESATSFFLGFFVGGSKDLFIDASSQMRKKHPLEENQYYSHYVSSEIVETFAFGLFGQRSLKLQADIIEFYSDLDTLKFDQRQDQLEKITEKKPKYDTDDIKNQDYKKIVQLKQCNSCEFESISNSDEIELGEFIMIKGKYDRIFGKVESFDERKVKVKSFLSPGASFTEDYPIKSAYKIIQK